MKKVISIGNLYHFCCLLWRLDISVWQVNESTNTHTIADKERQYVEYISDSLLHNIDNN
jgi:hypothetical protein